VGDPGPPIPLFEDGTGGGGIRSFHDLGIDPSAAVGPFVGGDAILLHAEDSFLLVGVVADIIL